MNSSLKTLFPADLLTYSRLMQVRASQLVSWLLCGALCATASGAVAKVHVITFGKWTSVPWHTGDADDKPIPLKVRALMVDGRVKEYMLGAPHEVTERLFVVRRVFRVNDGLPEDSSPRWQW